MHAARMMPPAERVWPAGSGRARHLRMILLALAGSGLLALSARVQIPFWPVPMTLQTGALLLVALAYGRNLALVTVAVYLLEGMAGLPVFAGTPERGVGLAYLLGPTGGYLAGFLPAAWIAGAAVERLRGTLPLLAALVGALLAVYVPGVLWLAGFLGIDRAVSLGVTPFLPAELVKLALVVTIARFGVLRATAEPIDDTE